MGRACLQAFARSWDNLTSMPSKLCVVSKSQDEALRIELMHNVTNYGFVGKFFPSEFFGNTYSCVLDRMLRH